MKKITKKLIAITRIAPLEKRTASQRNMLVHITLSFFIK